MTSAVLDRSLRHLAVAAIDGYRCHLSPRKGFACPHRLLTGVSCSERVRRALVEQTLPVALATARRQFGACTEAARTLKRRNSHGTVRCIVIPCCLPL